MASCNNCGRDVSPEARVCSHCGQPKPAEAVTSSSEQEEEFTGLFLLAFVAAPLASAAAFGVLWVLLLFVGSAKQILGFGVANINYETLKLLSLSGAGLIFLVLEFFAFKSLVDHPMAIFKSFGRVMFRLVKIFLAVAATGGVLYLISRLINA